MPEHEVRQSIPVFLRGYVRGTLTGEYYEEFLLLSGRQQVKGNPLLSYSLQEAQHFRDTEYCVWISKTLLPRPRTALSRRLRELITGFLGY